MTALFIVSWSKERWAWRVYPSRLVSIQILFFKAWIKSFLKKNLSQTNPFQGKNTMAENLVEKKNFSFPLFPAWTIQLSSFLSTHWKHNLVIVQKEEKKEGKWINEKNPFQSPSCYCNEGKGKILFFTFLFCLMDFSFLRFVDLSFVIKRFIHEWHGNKCPEFNRFPINVVFSLLCMKPTLTT